MISKRVLLTAFLAVSVVGIGSASVLDSFGSVSGTAEVKRPLEILEINANSPISGEDSGEYIILESNLDEVELSEWNLSVQGSNEDEINATRTVTHSKIALVDNTSTVKNTSEDLENIELVDIGSISGGLSNGGDIISLSYIPDSNAEVQAVEYYKEEDCGDTESFYVKTGGCIQSTLEIGETQ